MPIASHIGVRHMMESDRFEMLHADYIPNSSLVNHSFECPEIRGIPQHMTNADKATVLTCLTEDVGTFLGSLRNRFFQ